jgi:4-hydroxybenzoate polyprenyltransferase
MDDEQRERMHDLKRLTWWGVLIGGAHLVIAIVAGVFLRDDWSAFLFAGSLFLVLTIVMFVSQWRYIRRGPFPRLPVGMGDDTTADPSAKRSSHDS